MSTSCRPPACPPGARLLPLTQGQYAIVDEADFEDLTQFNWYAYRRKYTFYVRRTVHLPGGGQRTELLHRRLLPEAGIVDHIDGNGLDNRRANLRAATKSENGRNRRGRQGNNTSGFVGVAWHRRHAKWQAYITRDGRRSLGDFDSPVAAAIARDLAAIELHGEFASLNFPGLHRRLPIVARSA